MNEEKRGRTATVATAMMVTVITGILSVPSNKNINIK